MCNLPRILYSIFVIIFGYENLISQPFTSPGLEWQQITWSPTSYNGPQTQAQSADDWWYSHKNIYSGNQHIGYISCGYSAFVYYGNDLGNLQDFFQEGVNSCYNPFQTPPSLNSNCEDLYPQGTERVTFLGTLAYHNLKGDMQWFKSYCIGDLQEVIQDGNYLYVTGYHVGTKNLSHTSFLKYNPSVSSPNDNFDLSGPNPPTCNNNSDLNLIYTAKLDLNGNIIWENLYGMFDYNNQIKFRILSSSTPVIYLLAFTL